MSLHTPPTLRRWVRLLLWIALLLGLTGLTTTPVLVRRAQPLVLRAADEHPDSTLRLIVQKTGDANVEQAVAALGGLVTRDLSIINGFAADVPARAALPLSRVGVYTGVVSALGVAGIAASLFNQPDDAVGEE